jgi:hypothetical protein
VWGRVFDPSAEQSSVLVHSPVILSEAADSRRESAAQSKDPFRANSFQGSKRSFYYACTTVEERRFNAA